MKFLVPNYSCLQNPWLGGYCPQIPVLSVLCPQLYLWNLPPNKIPGYATAHEKRFGMQRATAGSSPHQVCTWRRSEPFRGIKPCCTGVNSRGTIIDCHQQIKRIRLHIAVPGTCRFVMDRMAMGKVSFQLLVLSPHQYLSYKALYRFIYRRRYVTVSVLSNTLKQ
jgi:hypothetical protein